MDKQFEKRKADLEQVGEDETLTVILKPKEGQKTISEELNSFNEMFPNGFTSWQETHYEFIGMIEQCRLMEKQPNKIKDINDNQGTGGFWELAKELTDKFEKAHEGYEFDGEFFDSVEEKFNEWLNG